MVTMMVRMTKGDQALAIWPTLWWLSRPASAWCWLSKRKMRFGFQFFRKTVRQIRLTSAEVMSGSSGSDVVGGEELGDGEAAGHQDGRPGFLDAAPAVHHGDQPEQHDHRQQRELAAGHLADLEGVDAGHLAADDDGMPIAPKATRAVLAIRHRPAA